jgi:hypothetical protein
MGLLLTLPSRRRLHVRQIVGCYGMLDELLMNTDRQFDERNVQLSAPSTDLPLQIFALPSLKEQHSRISKIGMRLCGSPFPHFDFYAGLLDRNGGTE